MKLYLYLHDEKTHGRQIIHPNTNERKTLNSRTMEKQQWDDSTRKHIERERTDRTE